MRAMTIILLAAALGLAAPASATPVKPWIEVNGTWSTYAMSDMNDFVGLINGDLVDYGMKLDEIKNGFGIGGRFGLDLPAGVALGVGYDRLLASTDVSQFGLEVKFSHPANAFRAFVEYGLPLQGPVGLHLGASGGMVSQSGKLELSALGQGSESLKMTGTGPLFEGYLSSSIRAVPQFGITGTLGYRYAKVGEVKGELFGVKETLVNADGSNMTTDYSGVFLRLGLKFAFTK